MMGVGELSFQDGKVELVFYTVKYSFYYRRVQYSFFTFPITECMTLLMKKHE